MKKTIKIGVFVAILSLVMPVMSFAQSTGTTNNSPTEPASNADTVSSVSEKVFKAINKAVKAKRTNRSSKIDITPILGGSNYVTGRTYDLSYDGSHTVATNYNFYLTRDVRDGNKNRGVVGAVYLGSTSNQSHFTFRVPYSVASWPGLGTGYRVVICGKKTNSTSNDSCSIRGVSDTSFRIVDINGNDNGNQHPIEIGERLTKAKYVPLKILSPDGGETFEAGKKYTIKWKGGIPNAKISFSLLTNTGGYSGGFSDAQFIPILTNIENDGSESWTVPSNLPKTTYKLMAEFSRNQIPGYVDWPIQSWDFSEDTFEVVAGNSTSNTQ